MGNSDHDQHASFEKLLEPHLDRLYRMAFRLAGNKSEAEDLFQDVLTKIYPRIGDLIDIEDRGSWLCRIMYNHFIDNRRRYARQRLVAVSEDRLPEGQGIEELPGGGTYINSGTWTWRADFGSSDEQTWKNLFAHPERFTDDRVLSYVRIDYDAEGQPSGRLLNYEPGAEGPSWGMIDGDPSIWHRIEDWIRRLASYLGTEI